jgi:hypothetical protein
MEAMMMKRRIVGILLALALLAGIVIPAAAQLGDNDFSSFTVQNLDTSTATVSVMFVNEAGTTYGPTEVPTLNGGQPNPFTLAPGESFEIYVPGIPAGLPDGRYSVVVSSDKEVAAIANIIGEGAINFNGSYSGFALGDSTFYLPAVVFNYYGWYSLISVQNVGASATDVTVNITCESGLTGSLSQTGVPSMASVHFDLNATTPVGFTGSSVCNGSAVITTSGENVVVVDNQRAPASGNTQSYSGVISGATSLNAPALYNAYYGWDASVNILKLGGGSTNVTVTYSDTGTSNCNLTDIAPNCLLYMPTAHPSTGYFGATITSDTLPVVAVVNAANGAQAQTYNAVASGTETVGIPSVMKSYYGWDTSVTCQNVGGLATTLHLEYDGYSGSAYDTASLATGDTVEIYTPGEGFLPSSHQGGLTVTANTSGAEIACIVNFNNPVQMGSTVGDWSMSYNAFNK